MNRIVIAHMLDDEAKEIIDALRKRFDPKTASAIGAHVTLAGPIDSEVPATDYVPRIKQIAENQVPFAIRFRGIDSFMPISMTIFTSIADVGRLPQLNASLLRILGWKEKFPYHPHSTISEYLNEVQTRDAYLETKKLEIDMTHVVSTMSLLQKDPSGKWAEIEILTFGPVTSN